MVKIWESSNLVADSDFILGVVNEFEKILLLTLILNVLWSGSGLMLFFWQ